MNSRLFSLLILLFLFNPTFSFARGNEFIIADGQQQYWDLSGADGHDGKDGKDAYAPDCDGIRILSGRDGENGSDGEDADHGADAFIRFDNFEDLANITLNQVGGIGGTPGAGGRGAHGCNGGASGVDGVSGSPGVDGDFGRIYLIDSTIDFTKDDLSTMTMLESFYNSSISFHKNNWTQVSGAKKLFSKNSLIKDEYYLFEGDEDINVSLKWSANLPISDFFDTKLGIAYRAGRVALNSISGVIFDYIINYEKKNSIVIEIKNVIFEYHFKNLRFGRMRDVGEDLNLEIKEKLRPNISIDTTFIITLFEMDEVNQKERVIGYFSIPEALIEKRNKSFFINIGRLNFPSKFKRMGTKLKVHASIYRKSRGQTRIVSLRGIFKI